ncbi:prepilin peptidase dependent protein B [uncultured Paraglaciecola sp.]|uniref:prepilin peptidase dependent protein B n=1 Tax=uncultured Paraglaciecola sp. TaxID=1765024 RepID=UPI00259A322E|nr:prepilin peptidase dependent protein B [uncultured Paraglaciecola sp.]
MLSQKSKQNGNSLVELMISIGLGFASMTAMSSLVGHGIALNSQLMTKSRLNAEINAVLAVVSQDLGRAGYQAFTKELLDDPTAFINPFHKSVALSEYVNESANSCITFAYDRNKNGKLDVINTNENYGYRLRDNAIEMRVDGLGCDKGGWQDLTDSTLIKVNTLSFETSKIDDKNIEQTRVTIQLEAELLSDPDLSRTAALSVSIKNYD